MIPPAVFRTTFTGVSDFTRRVTPPDNYGPELILILKQNVGLLVYWR